jgi:hypothetical protein
MKLDVLVLVALVALQSALLTFYWSHCAGPALVHAGARPRTFRVVQTVGVLSLVGFVIAIAIRLSRIDVPAWLWVVIAGLTGWYLLAWPRPRWVARISGGVDDREILRQAIWRLNWASRELMKDPDSASRRNTVEQCREAVRRLPRSVDTGSLIDAWLAESEAVLEGGPDAAESNRQRYMAIVSEARRLWPDADTGSVAIPSRPIEQAEREPA